ncbi:hypothetical protein KKA15_03610 [Patescibacteria group bacterium]|nr:hypothetical protein [Patescibacteria group bacterium]
MTKANKINKELLEKIFTDRKVRTELTKQDHYWFFHTYFTNHIQYPTAKFQKEIISLTQNQNLPIVAIISFRDSAKSTIVTESSVIWSILGMPQKKFVVILAKTQQQARLHFANMKGQLESNEWLKNDFGPLQIRDAEWTASSLILPKYKAKIICASIDQSIRGLRFNEHRPDLIIADDLEDDLSTRNKEIRDKTYNWFLREVLPLGEKDTKIMIVGNLLHPDSLIMRLKADMDKKKRKGIFRKYPIIADDKSMWPEKFPTMKDIDELKLHIGDDKAWNQEFLLNEQYDDNYIIQPEWISTYKEILENEKDFRFYAIGIDPAVVDKENSCYSAMVILKVYGNWDKLRMYVLPNPINKRMEFPTLIETIKQNYDYFRVQGPTKIFTEDIAAQGYVTQQLNHEDLPAEGVVPKGDKDARLQVLSHAIRNKKIIFPEIGADELITQLVEFKNITYKDLADAFSLVCNKVIVDDKRRVKPEIFTIRY